MNKEVKRLLAEFRSYLPHFRSEIGILIPDWLTLSEQLRQEYFQQFYIRKTALGYCAYLKGGEQLGQL